MKAETDEAVVLTTMTGPIAVPTLEFKKINSYTTFAAEYAQDGADIVFHFFLPPELEQQGRSKPVRQYWEKDFPLALVESAMQVFRETQRLKFDYVGEYELDSWWFRAFGYGTLLDVDGICTRLFDILDQALETTKKT